MAGRELARDLDPITLDLVHARAQHSGHLAGMRRETARGRRIAQDVEVAGERSQSVGVDGHRLAKLAGQRARNLRRLVVEADPGTDRDGVTRFGELEDRLARLQRQRPRRRLRQRLGHRLEHEARDDRLLARGCRDGDEPGAAAHRRHRAQRGRAGLAERARHQEQMTVRPLVARARAPREVAGEVTRLEQERRHSACDLAVGDADRDHRHPPGELGTGRGDQPALEPGERQGHRRSDHRAGVRSGVRGEPRRDVERDDGPAAGVDRLDGARDAAFGHPA